MTPRRPPTACPRRRGSAAWVCLLVLLLACGCSEPDSERAVRAGAVPSPASAAADTVTRGDDKPRPLGSAYADIRAWRGDLDGMLDRRVIRILTVYSVGRYYLDGADERGIVRESANQFEDFVNRKLGQGQPRVHVAIVPVARDQLIPALLAGRGDIIQASLTVTPSRQAQIDFSAPASKPLAEILVTGPTAPPLSSIEDLSGQTLYLRHSSSYRESVEALNARLRQAGAKPVRIEPVSELLEDADLVEMVNAGLLPWAIVDDYKLSWWEGVFESLVPRRDIVFSDGGRTAWGMRKHSPQLKALVNAFLEDHREGTLLGNVLVNRYVRDFDWAANALSDESYRRFEELEAMFREYGERYDIDHLMLAAQGYQESRLDQSARSAAGAVGVMQIKPSTAADPNVGIRGIDKVEPNIHAGTKYLSFLRGRYFNQEGVDERNRLFLALAAYNAGPARMARLRQQTVELGYDPNVWFDNVEIAAAKYVGREPVQYVANVYKYYMAYRLSAALLSRRSEAREEAGIEPLDAADG